MKTSPISSKLLDTFTQHFLNLKWLQTNHKIQYFLIIAISVESNYTTSKTNSLIPNPPLLIGVPNVAMQAHALPTWRHTS